MVLRVARALFIEVSYMCGVWCDADDDEWIHLFLMSLFVVLFPPFLHTINSINSLLIVFSVCYLVTGSCCF